jgi:hypothetical protein
MDALLERWERTGDRRAIFLDCYARMTRAMERELATDGFVDAEWVEQLLDRFAHHYFVATEAWERGDDQLVPAPWRLAHTATTRGTEVATLPLLLVGVNAHINYDLVLTLVDLFDTEGVGGDPDRLARRKQDYDHVNRVIAATADEVQDLVVERYSPSLDLADRMLGRLDEWAAVRLLTGWRDGVWRHAVQVLEADPPGRSLRVHRRAESCERRGRRLLLGSRLVP